MTITFARQPDLFSSHLAVLAGVLAWLDARSAEPAGRGNVLELGVGCYSTPVLHAMCAADGRRLVSIDSVESWFRLFEGYGGGRHAMLCGDATRLMHPDAVFDLAFVDNLSAERSGCLRALKGRARFLVIHDTELYAGLAPDLALWANRLDVTPAPWPNQTTIVSDEDLSDLRRLWP